MQKNWFYCFCSFPLCPIFTRTSALGQEALTN
jgi:hypothetical protein